MQKYSSVGFTYISSNNNNNNRFKIGKFSQGEDYHKVIYKKLSELANGLTLKFLIVNENM